MPGKPDATAYAIPTGTSIVASTSPATTSCRNHTGLYRLRIRSPGNQFAQLLRCVIWFSFPVRRSQEIYDINRCRLLPRADWGTWSVAYMSALGQKQTCATHKPMSAMCQKQTFEKRPARKGKTASSFPIHRDQAAAREKVGRLVR